MQNKSRQLKSFR